MVTSRAATVEDYLDELPPDRRRVMAGVRDVIVRVRPAATHALRVKAQRS